MRLKTAPRVVLGLAVVGALAVGVNYYIDHRPKPAQSAPVEPQVSVPQEAVQPAVVAPQAAPVVAAPQPLPAAPAPAPQAAPVTQQDRAMADLLKAQK